MGDLSDLHDICMEFIYLGFLFLIDESVSLSGSVDLCVGGDESFREDECDDAEWDDGKECENEADRGAGEKEEPKGLEE